MPYVAPTWPRRPFTREPVLKEKAAPADRLLQGEGFRDEQHCPAFPESQEPGPLRTRPPPARRVPTRPLGPPPARAAGPARAGGGRRVASREEGRAAGVAGPRCPSCPEPRVELARVRPGTAAAGAGPGGRLPPAPRHWAGGWLQEAGCGTPMTPESQQGDTGGTLRRGGPRVHDAGGRCLPQGEPTAQRRPPLLGTRDMLARPPGTDL